MKVKNTFALGLLLIFGLALPDLASANVFSNALAGFSAIVFGLISNILGILTGAFLGMAVWIFNFVLSPGFISLSYTNAGLSPGDPHFNIFLQTGWELTRNLTNIFFVLGLVVMGLGTALRIKNYEVQKTLPIFIGIALLINFTPVILGLVVDASNIAMNFFVQGGFAAGNEHANYAFRQFDNIGSLVGGARFWDPTANQEAVSAAIGSFVLIFFNLIAGMIYLLFALVFILRYIAIWILVILSPIAFACYIFPATKKIFSQWWNQFLQWSLVGVIAAFFLYLGDHIVAETNRQDFLAASIEEIGNASGLATIMNNILPHFISIIFLFIGLIMSLSFAPKGASAIIQAGQKGMKASGKVLGTRSWQGAKQTAKIAGNAVIGSPKALGHIYKRYRTSKRFGASGQQALGVAIGGTWRQAKRRTIKQTKAAGKGIGRALRDSAKTGWGAALGLKRKGKKKCPYCGNMIAASAKICPMPGCGADLD